MKRNEVKKPTISYLVLASHNPVVNIPLKQIKRTMDKGDELIILVDSNTVTEKVERIISKYPFSKVVRHPLSYSYSDHRNEGLKHCTKDYIMALDDDEKMSDELASNLKNIIMERKQVGEPFHMCLIHRINTLTHITEEHRKVLGSLLVGDQLQVGLDLQTRFFINKYDYKWEGNLHEQVKCYEENKIIQCNFPYCIYHSKTAEQHITRNQMYLQKYTSDENKGTSL